MKSISFKTMNIEIEVAETLCRINNRCQALKANTEDINRPAYNKIIRALSLLDKSVEVVFKKQKKRGKIFISNEDIDEIFTNL